MTRLRKAAKTWRRADSQTLASRVLIADDGPVFEVKPRALFGRDALLEAEIGAGRGEFIIARAAAMPERNFLAIELALSVARLLAVRIARAELANVRVVRADARTIVNLLLPDRSVAAYHIYFPDPWPKPRQIKHRLFSDHFVSGLARTLCDGGICYVASDVRDYAAQIFAMFEAGRFRRMAGESVPGAIATGFARKYRAGGKEVFAAAFERSARRAMLRGSG